MAEIHGTAKFICSGEHSQEEGSESGAREEKQQCLEKNRDEIDPLHII